MRTIHVQSSADSGPCGGCRQFINEFAADDAVWIKHDTTNDTVTSRPFRDPLPFDLGPRHLGVWSQARTRAVIDASCGIRHVSPACAGGGSS